MNQPYKINIFNSLVFIACGVCGFVGRYLSHAEFQPTALIPFVLGMLLLVLTPGMKSENKVIVLGAFFLTLIFGIVISSMLVSEIGVQNGNVRKIAIFSVITVSSLVSIFLYSRQYLKRKKAVKD